MPAINMCRDGVYQNVGFHGGRWRIHPCNSNYHVLCIAIGSGRSSSDKALKPDSNLNPSETALSPSAQIKQILDYCVILLLRLERIIIQNESGFEKNLCRGLDRHRPRPTCSQVFWVQDSTDPYTVFCCTLLSPSYSRFHLECHFLSQALQLDSPLT